MPGGLRFGTGMELGPAVKFLILANVSVWLGLGGLEFANGQMGAELYQLLSLTPRETVQGFRIWQPFTYMFLHGGLLHLLMNMFVLWMFAPPVEARWGRDSFLTYYVVCGLGGALLTVLFSLLPGGLVSPLTTTVGASGAVLGILLAYAMMDPDAKILLYFIFPLKIKYLIYGIVVIDLIGGLSGVGDGIAHFAHLGGIGAGFLWLKQDFRMGNLGKKLRGARARRTMGRHAQRDGESHAHWKRPARLSVDEILDKISEKGMESLSEDEKQVLRDARRN